MSFILHERGMALVLVLMVSALLFTALLTGYAIMESAFKTAAIELSRDQVTSVTLAGVEDALTWFRSTAYGKPPVKTVFDPLNAGQMRGTTQVLFPETQDSSIGIVRDFPIGLNNRLFGHYEVKNTLVQDITSQRLPGSGASGLIWHIQVDGAIYKREDATVPYNQSPNQVLRTLTMGTEIRRMALSPPQAALTTYLASNIWIHSQGEVRNDSGTAILYRDNTGNITNDGLLVGGQGVILSDPLFDSAVGPLTVFGMTLAEFKAFVQNNSSGIYINNSADFNSKLVPYPSNSATPPIVYIEGSSGFSTVTINLYDTNTNLPINAYGVLVADGIDLTILGGPLGCGTNNCGQFTGFVYASGALSVDNGAVISGAIVSTLKSQGIGGSKAIQIGSNNVGAITRLVYNGPYIFSVLNQAMGNYSISLAPYILR